MKTFLFLFTFLILISNVSRSQIWDQKLNGRSVWSLSKDHSGNIFAGGLTGNNSRIWKSSNGGDSWDTIHFGSGQTMWDFGYDYQGNMYVANYSTGMLKSTDHGVTFTLLPSSMFNNKNLQGVECGASGYIFATTSTGFFRSTDNGASFNETFLSGLNCLPVLVDIDSSNIVYVGVTGSTSVGFYRSTDNGLTFSSNLRPVQNGFNMIQKPNGDLYLITTTSPFNIDRSTDKGLTWTSVGTISNQRGITSSVSGNIFTSGNGGVFRSTNNGASFTNFNFTTTATPVLSVNYNSSLKVFTGTSGASGGVWRCTEGPAPSIIVNLKVILEGMYNASTTRLNRRNSVSLYLRDSFAPYRIRDSANAFIDTVTLSGQYNFVNTTTGTYYLVVKYFNTLETWSKAGGESFITTGIGYGYDFTSAASQAYGGNMKLVSGKYCVYSGDVLQNGLIDLADILTVYNDVSVFASGYIPTDVNGDNIADLTDLIFTFNNATAFVHIVRP